MPKVSIIVPVYNTEKYLRKCLNSLVNQTLKDIEIIIINDGSTDDSLNIIKEYKKVYKDKIIYDSIPNSGSPGAPRNIAIEMAKGEYIGFVDSDDWVELNMYEELYNFASENKLDISECILKHKIGPISIINNNPEYKIGSPKNNREILALNDPTICCKIYKRKLFKNIEYPTKILYEDLAIIQKVLIRAKRIGQVKKAFYNYKIQPNSIIFSSMIKLNPRISEIIPALTYLNELFTKSEKKRFYNEIVAVNIRHINFSAFYISISLKLNRQEKEELINLLFSYLDNNYPNWEKNIYYLDNFNSKSADKRMLKRCKKFLNKNLRVKLSNKDLEDKIRKYLSSKL